MKRLVALVFMTVLGAPALAQLEAPPRTTVEVVDPTNIINDRGSKLEVYPTQRATPLLDAQRRTVVHRVMMVNANSPMGAKQLGVVFNHAMQQRGFITGEIAFRSMTGGRPTDITANNYPGLKRITVSGVYVVKAGTPAEFISLMRRLQARSDLEWVEPTVTYGPTDTVPSAR